MCVPLLLFLSAVVLHSVSAGGVYCAKTARARAAALGLDYPGDHGAPDLSGPARHGMRSGTMPSRPYNNNDPEWDEVDPHVASYRPAPDDRIHKQASHRSQHGISSPVKSIYTTDRVLSLPRGPSVFNRKSSFDEVKHVAPPTLSEAPGQSDLVNWYPQGHNKPLSFVSYEHDFVFDESVPNRRGMSLSGLPQHQSGGHWRGRTGFGLGEEVPVLSSSGITSKNHVRAMTSPSPAAATPKRIRFPGRLTQPRHRRLKVKPFSQDNPVLRRVIENQVRLE